MSALATTATYAARLIVAITNFDDPAGPARPLGYDAAGYCLARFSMLDSAGVEIAEALLSRKLLRRAVRSCIMAPAQRPYTTIWHYTHQLSFYTDVVTPAGVWRAEEIFITANDDDDLIVELRCGGRSARCVMPQSALLEFLDAACAAYGGFASDIFDDLRAA